MLTIDAQVHAYERDHAERPWVDVLAGPPEVTGDDMVLAMDSVGVDGAILVSPWTMYRYDESYAVAVYVAHPERFRLVKPVDPTDPGVAETITEWALRDGVVGIRIMLSRGVSGDPDDPGVSRVLTAAAHHGLPTSICCTHGGGCSSQRIQRCSLRTYMHPSGKRGTTDSFIGWPCTRRQRPCDSCSSPSCQNPEQYLR